MQNKLRHILVSLSIGLSMFHGAAYADTFEFLNYTPPAGWTKQALQTGIAYQRGSGTGLISFYASGPATGSDAVEFAKMWRARVEPHLPGAVPQPEFQREGEYTATVGNRVMNAKEGLTTVTLVVFAGNGRALGVMAMATGDEAIREVRTFFDSIAAMPGKPPTSTPGPVSAGDIEVEFAVPPGYVSKREGRMIQMVPTTINEKTPCAYGMSPSRPSSGDLETDARAALLEPHPGWRLKDANYNAIRGIAADGWKYFLFNTGIELPTPGEYQNLYAMAMAFPAPEGRVNIVWGIGNPAYCNSEDLAFARLFHSLRPRGWTSDGGKAFARELQGTWRYTHSYGLIQYKFMANGRYEHGRGATTTLGMRETTTSGVADGAYKLNGSELMLSGTSKFRVRIYEKYAAKGWWRVMSMLNENANPPSETEYERVQN